MKKADDFLDNKAFTFEVTGYNHVTREYTLYNRHTGQTKIVPKEEYLALVEENKKMRKRDPI